MFSSPVPLRTSRDYIPPALDVSVVMDDRVVESIMASGTEDATYRDKFLRDEEIRRLCDKLRVQPKRKLILRGNFIGAGGAQAIAALVGAQDELRELSLEWNQVGTAGAMHFADALKTNRSLVNLDLKNNSIGSDAAAAIAEALAENPSLRHLDLRWNQVMCRCVLCAVCCVLCAVCCVCCVLCVLCAVCCVCLCGNSIRITL